MEVDREEILVVGELPDVELPKDAGAAARDEARRARIASFREETRGRRMRIAVDAQRRFRRKVSWGARCGELRALFTTVSLPVMTRLRMDERRVLDTLVDAGVARSRSHALAWCVRLVAEHESEWIEKLQEALVDVEKARAEGPGSRRKA
ncbi:MAG: hypothetical protein ACRDJ5_01305 [Actinomycetota bacterium]